MDTENSLPPLILSKEAFKSPLILTKFSGFAMILFAFFVSIGALDLSLLQIPQTASDQNFRCVLLSIACLTFFLGVTLLPLLFTMNSINPLGPIWARLIDYLAIATLIASFTTLILALCELYMALPDLKELSDGKVSSAIQSALICFAVAKLYKLIGKKFTSCHHKCLSVAFFALGVAFAGLYTGPLYYLPGTIPYSYFIYRTDCLYHFTLIWITFVLGSILLIIGVVPAVGLRLPFGSVISKEGLTVSTLAVGLTTLLTGTFSMIYVALVNLAMPGGFRIGGAWRAIDGGVL